jgi:hypothetical protein
MEAPDDQNKIGLFVQFDEPRPVKYCNPDAPLRIWRSEGLPSAEPPVHTYILYKTLILRSFLGREYML